MPSWMLVDANAGGHELVHSPARCNKAVRGIARTETKARRSCTRFGEVKARKRRIATPRETPACGSKVLIMSTATPFEHRAAAAGLTEPVVRSVVTSFYDRVRSDAVLGPVFSDAIRDWDAHLERIVRFWLTATRLDRGYDGRNFMPAHLRRGSIRADQLPRWLALFRATAAELCATDAAAVLIDIAERMSETLAIGLGRRDAGESVPHFGAPDHD